MKKSLLAVMAILLLCFTPAKAQTDDSNERAQQQIDSLNQIVARLSEKVEDQEEEMEMADVWSRRKFFNIGFSRLKLTHREIANLSWKSDFSISLTYGKTIYFHKKPIANMIKFGLDYSFMDRISPMRSSCPMKFRHTATAKRAAADRTAEIPTDSTTSKLRA